MQTNRVLSCANASMAIAGQNIFKNAGNCSQMDGVKSGRIFF